MEIGGHAAIDWSASEEVEEAVRARGVIEHDTPWERLFELVFLPSYRVLDNPEHSWIDVSFRLTGEWHDMFLRQFATHSGFYTLSETETPSTMRLCTRYTDRHSLDYGE
ncbi:hypothetical protein Hanom_Chr09g00864941 [Helianthus anomalus]